MRKMLDSLIMKLLLGVFLGIFIGLYAGEKVIVLIATVKYLLGQIIFFVVPIIILGFITPAIARLKSNASKMLGTMILLAYISSLGAATFSMIAGYSLIPNLNISVVSENLRTIPEILFIKVSCLFPILFPTFEAIKLRKSHQNDDPKKTPDTKENAVKVSFGRIPIPAKIAINESMVAGLVTVKKNVEI